MRLSLCLLSLVWATQGCFAAEFVWVEPGREPVPVLVAPDAPPRTREAARQLADYVGKICGRTPSVVDSVPATPPERAVWVGVQPLLRQLLPDARLAFDHPEETLILATEQHLVIAGRDRWDPQHMEQKGRLSMKTAVQQEYGTANAVYTFLRQPLGVRWLWPGEEDVPRRDRLAVAVGETRYHPQIRARSGLLVKLSLGDNKEGPDELWARFQRVQLDSMDIDGGHGFGDWWERHGAAHPEYFAAAPDGTRKPSPFSPRYTKLCASNPAVWKQWLEETSERLRADPLLRVINVSPNDGYTAGHCTCANCLAWDHPQGEKVEWTFAGGVKFQGVSQTDRDVRFANTLARLLRERFPDRELHVLLNAYGLARNAPIGVMPDDNVLISSVANFSMRSPASRELPMAQHAAWAAKAKHLVWRPNLGSQAGLSWGMPDVAMTQAGEDFRFVAQHGGIGLFFDLFWLHWSTQGPHYYALAHLAWNPQEDVAALMDDYYQRGFGPAADEVKAYWTLLERTRMEFVAEEPSRQRAFLLPQKYTPELMAQVQAHLDAAAAKLTDAGAVYRRRLHFIQCGLDFTKLVVDTRAWMQKVESGREPGAKARVLENWRRAEAMKKAFPEFAINWQAVFREGTDPKRCMGLHPKLPLSGRVLRELQDDGLE